MATYDEVLELARQLGPDSRARLVGALGGGAPGGAARIELRSLAERPPAPQSVAWVKAERGHAVLATDTGPAEADIPAGADAIAGMWRDAAGGQP
jgi:hypothetical protein